MPNFRNFTFPKKKAMDNDAAESSQLRPFLLGLPREEAIATINSSRPPKRVSRQSFIQMNVPARDRQTGLRGTSNGSGNDTKIYVPFAPQPSDLASLMVPKKPDAKCHKCNSNIVLCRVNKKNGDVNVANAHLGETFNITQGQDENGAPITVPMVWACRINRHVFPTSNPNNDAQVTPTAVADPKTAPKRLTFAGAQRWVNEMQGLLRSGDAIRAKECMTQIVLMNEGMKRESFSWLEKEKASRLAAALNLPKEISTFREEEEEKSEEPDDGEKLLKDFFAEEGNTIFQMITSEGNGLDYSGLVIGSRSESPSSKLATNDQDEAKGEPSTVHEAKGVVTVTTCIRDTKENLSPDDKPAENQVPGSSSLPTAPSHSDLLPKEETPTSRPLSKRFSLTNLLGSFKKTSPSIKRIEGKRDLGKYAEEQAVAASLSPVLLPAHGQSLSLQEMLQEPFHRIAGGSLEHLPGGQRDPEYSLASSSGNLVSGAQSRTPSFITDKSDNGSDSAREIERGLTVVTVTSEASGKPIVGGSQDGEDDSFGA
ncbi:hypothetical protein TWF281_004531 [Arthrobotrys megalospora]